jgi:hypothetical protein
MLVERLVYRAIFANWSRERVVENAMFLPDVKLFKRQNKIQGSFVLLCAKNYQEPRR